jgi:hypothetical protein
VFTERIRVISVPKRIPEKGSSLKFLFYCPFSLTKKYQKVKTAKHLLQNNTFKNPRNPSHNEMSIYVLIDLFVVVIRGLLNANGPRYF